MIRIDIPSVNEKGVVISYLSMHTCARNISLQKLSPNWLQSSKMLVVSHTYRNKTTISLNLHLQGNQYLVTHGHEFNYSGKFLVWPKLDWANFLEPLTKSKVVPIK